MSSPAGTRQEPGQHLRARATGLQEQCLTLCQDQGLGHDRRIPAMGLQGEAPSPVNKCDAPWLEPHGPAWIRRLNKASPWADTPLEMPTNHHDPIGQHHGFAADPLAEAGWMSRLCGGACGRRDMGGRSCGVQPCGILIPAPLWRRSSPCRGPWWPRAQWNLFTR